MIFASQDIDVEVKTEEVAMSTNDPKPQKELHKQDNGGITEDVLKTEDDVKNEEHVNMAEEVISMEDTLHGEETVGGSVGPDVHVGVCTEEVVGNTVTEGVQPDAATEDMHTSNDQVNILSLINVIVLYTSLVYLV